MLSCHDIGNLFSNTLDLSFSASERGGNRLWVRGLDFRRLALAACGSLLARSISECLRSGGSSVSKGARPQGAGPTESEPPFLGAELTVLTIRAAKRFRTDPAAGLRDE